jgi:hypothetical protein
LFTWKKSSFVDEHRATSIKISECEEWGHESAFEPGAGADAGHSLPRKEGAYCPYIKLHADARYLPGSSDQDLARNPATSSMSILSY